MKITTALVVAVALGWQVAPDQRHRALEIVKKVNGTVVIDAKVPGEPVVALNL